MNMILVSDTATVWPYSKAQLKRDNPRTSFPKQLSFPIDTPLGKVHAVSVEPKPDAAPGKVVLQDATPTLANGVYTLGWTVRDKTADEIAAERAAMQTSREKFAVKAALAGIITENEMKAWVGGTALPAIAETAFDAIEDKAERLTAKANALATLTIRRSNPLILMLQAQYDLTDEQVDGLFA